MTHREVLEGARVLDVRKRSLQVLKLDVDFRLCFLCLCNLKITSAFQQNKTKVGVGVCEGTNTHRLGLERLDGFNVRADVVCDGLEVAQGLLCLVDDGLVLQDGAVVG